jgi:hypothetical protein
MCAGYLISWSELESSPIVPNNFVFYELDVEKGMLDDISMKFVKVVVFLNRMSYIILRGRWCNIIVLNVHAPTEDKIDDKRIGSVKN